MTNRLVLVITNVSQHCISNLEATYLQIHSFKLCSSKSLSLRIGDENLGETDRNPWAVRSSQMCAFSEIIQLGKYSSKWYSQFYPHHISICSSMSPSTGVVLAPHWRLTLHVTPPELQRSSGPSSYGASRGFNQQSWKSYDVRGIEATLMRIYDLRLFSG